MSKISDEKLIVAAVKGNDEAIKLLKNRAKSGIQAALRKKGMQGSGNDVKVLESQVWEKVFNALFDYTFQSPFQTWVYRIASNMAVQHEKNKIVQCPIGKSYGEKLPPKVLMTLSQTPIRGKHPPLMTIDSEIRSLVVLLNQSPDIQTLSSCSGHPKQGKWNPYGGWISIIPTGNPCRALEFLVSLLSLLDNTIAMKAVNHEREDKSASAVAIRERYYQVDADKLFHSGVPIAIISVSFQIFVFHPEMARRLQIWKQLIMTIRDLITDGRELSSVINTPEMAVKCLQKALQQLPFAYGVKLVTDREGYLGLHFRMKVDLALCQWCLDLATRIDLLFDDTEYLSANAGPDKHFNAKWTFSLHPFLNRELIPLPHLITTSLNPRTREDHLKIWQLIELVVAEQLGLTKT